MWPIHTKFVFRKSTATSVKRAKLSHFVIPLHLCFKWMKFDLLYVGVKMIKCEEITSRKFEISVRNPQFLCLSAGGHAGSPTLWVYDPLNTYPGNHTQKIKKWIVQSQRFCCKSSAPFLEFSIFCQTFFFKWKVCPGATNIFWSLFAAKNSFEQKLRWETG